MRLNSVKGHGLLRWVVVGLALYGHPAVAGGSGPCPLAVSDATVWLLGLEKEAGEVERVSVSPVFFEVEPSVGSHALVLPYPEGEGVGLAVESADRDEDSAEPLWHVRLEDGRRTSLARLKAPPGRRPEAPGNAVVLWPAPKAPAILRTPEEDDLPPDVALETVKAAVDLDGDARPDVLVVEYCCGNRRSSQACEYHCGETWQRVGEVWRRCRVWQPA